MSVPVRSATELGKAVELHGLQAERAMIQLGWTFANVKWRDALAALVALAERAEDERDVAVKEHSRLLRMLRMEGARADAAEARVAELETTLKRIIAQFETNSEAGAPQYLFDALAAGSPTGQEQQA